LFIANPTGDLDAAVDEAENLAGLIERRLGLHPPHILCHHRATRKAVLGALSSGEYDLIHYTGHAFFDQRNPGASGLILAENKVLTAREIQDTLNGQPVVFLNACESARSKTISENDKAVAALAYAGLTAYGLASAFILGGARAFVGTLWGVYDEGSHKFARRFYQRTLQGETIGEALRWAREKARQDAPDDPIWASFALYGDPRQHLLEIEKERLKLLSVLSARVVGLPTLYERLGIEAASEIAGECLNHLHHEIVAHHGEVLSLAHDTVTATFGASATREDHAELALRAALAMRHAVARLNDQQASGGQLLLGIRIGVDAGDAMVRDVGPAGEGKITVMGLPFERARALQTQAGIDQILAGEGVYRGTKHVFDFGSSIASSIKISAPSPTPAYAVLGAKPKHERILEFAGSKTALVGREEELGILHTCWDRCRAGHGGVVGIVGEAGVGKSRLLYEFTRRVNDANEDKAAWLLGICQSHRRDVPFSWLIQIVRDLFELAPDDDQPAVAHKLQSTLENLGMRGRDLAEPFSILGEVLGIESIAGEITLRDPQVRQAHLIYYLKGLLAHRASERPVIIVLEDAHWIDEASLEIVEQSIGELTNIPVLALALCRPGRVFGWESKSYYRLISLTRLADDQSEALLCSLLNVGTLPQEMTHAILTRVEGNPFFLEEVVASLKETGVLVSSNGGWRAARPLLEAQIPGSIRGVLLARIDRLDPGDRQALQAAAVVGRDFPHRILAEIVSAETGNGDRLNASLIELKKRELIEETSVPLSPRRLWRYTFRHSLTQEVAYANLPVEQRRRYHRRIGEAIERIGETVAELYQRAGYIELLAHHYYRSVTVPAQEGRTVIADGPTQGDLAKVAGYLVEAGAKARRQYANREATIFYQQALSVVAELASDVVMQQATCYKGLGDAYHLMGEFDLTLDNFERAFSLLAGREAAADRCKAANIAGRIGRVYERKGGRDNLAAALEWRDEGLALLPETPTAEAALLHALGGIVSFRQADFDRANRQLERALSLAQETDARSELRLAHSMLSMSLHAQGHLDLAMEHCQTSIKLDQELSDSIGLAKDYSNRGAYAFEMDDWPLAQESYLQALAVLERIGDKYQLAISNCNLADLYCHLGDLAQGISYAQRGLDLFAALESYQGMIFAHAVLATLYWRLGDLEQAQTQLLEARKLEDTHGVTVFQPTVGRWLAQVYLTAGNVAQAETEIQAMLSLDVDVLADEAEPIQHLRGQLLAAQGKLAEAIQVLYASLARLEQKQMRYQTGGALLALAGVLAHKEDRAAEAKAHARRARDIFTDLGARLDVQKADTLIAELRVGESQDGEQ
ncbi:MAG: CHAT domain-containing protein, partial [Anaerolineae bacterium]